MAEKRMFSKKIIDTDWFMDMPASTQNLYFHLSMRADDDGFVANPKRIIKLVGASDDDYRLLIAKNFIIIFESGICVITDWRINNYLRADRYTETMYKEEKEQIKIAESGKYYTAGIPLGIPAVYPVYISSSNTLSNNKSSSNTINNTISKTNTIIDSTNSNTITDSIKGKEVKHKYGEYKNVLLTSTELEKLNNEYGATNTNKAIKYLDEYIEMKGAKYKSHYLVLRKWVYNAVEQHKNDNKDKQEEKRPDVIIGRIN